MKEYSVWMNTSDGGLRCVGIEPGRALSKKRAWEVVKDVRKGKYDAGESRVTFTKVLKGSSKVYAELRDMKRKGAGR